MQVRHVRSRWITAILCAGAILTAPLAALAGAASKPIAPNAGNAASTGNLSAPSLESRKATLYQRSVAWWPFASGPYYGEVAIDHYGDSDVIHTAVGSFKIGQRPNLPAELINTGLLDVKAAGRTTQYFLLQLKPSALEADFRATLASLGAVILYEEPVNSLIVRADVANYALLESSPIVQFIEPYHPAYKLNPSIGNMPQLTSEAAASPIFTLTAQLFPGESAQALSQMLSKLGAQITGSVQGAAGQASWLNLNAHAAIIPTLAKLEGIVQISEVGPTQLHSQGSLYGQSENWTPGNYPFWKAGLDGDGQVVEVTDAGISFDAPDTSDTLTTGRYDDAQACKVLGGDQRKIVCYRRANDFGGSGDFLSCDSAAQGAYTHGQVVSSVALGNSTRGKLPAPTNPSPTDSPDSTYVRAYGNGYYNDANHDGLFTELADTGYDGIAKGAKVVMVDATTTANCTSGSISAGNLTNTITGTMTDQKAYIHNYSFGSTPGPTGPVYSQASQIDSAVTTEPINFVTVSAGNDGKSADDGKSTTVGNIGDPATCKNCIPAGASDGEFGVPNYTRASFTSHGPSVAGRIAPVIFAEGTIEIACNSRDNDQLDPVECNPSVGNSGTSFASPNLAGSAAVIREYFANGFYPDGSDQNGTANDNEKSPSISSKLIKALMVVGTAPIIQGATAITDQRFNNIWGYGELFLNRALPLSTDSAAVPGLIVVDQPGADINHDGTSNDGVTHDTLSLNGSCGTGVGLCSGGQDVFEVNDATKDLAVALVWDDPNNASGAVDNNLDLEVRYCGPDKTCGNGDDVLFQGNNFGEDYDQDGSAYCDIDGDSSLDGYHWSLSVAQINTGVGKPTAAGCPSGTKSDGFRDTKNNTEAVFIPAFKNGTDRNADGTTDTPSLSDNAAGTLNPKTGTWQISIIRRSGTTNPLRYAVAIAGPVAAGSSVRFDTNPISCNGDSDVVVSERDDAGDPACTLASCPPSTISNRLTIESLDKDGVTVLDSIVHPPVVQIGTGLKYQLASRMSMTSAVSPGTDNFLTVKDGGKLRVKYDDVTGGGSTSKQRQSTTDVDCQPAIGVSQIDQIGADSFIQLNGGCDDDRYIDQDESFSLFLQYYNADALPLTNAQVTLRAMVPDGDNATDPCRNNNAVSSNITILDGTKTVPALSPQTFDFLSFGLRANGVPPPRTKVDLVFGLSSPQAGQQIENCYAVQILLQANDEKHLFMTDCPTGCTVNFDRNNDEKNEDRIAANPFDILDQIHRGQDETSIVYENMTVNNTSGWGSPCSGCGNPGFTGPWNFDANRNGFTTGKSPLSKLSATQLTPITNWGEDENWNDVLDAGENKQGGTTTLDQNWATTGGCGWMTSNGSARGAWHTGTIGTWVTSHDTAVCRPSDSVCQQYDRMAGTSGSEYWFETIRTPVIHPTRFGTDPDGFAWSTQILDYAWNGQVDWPAGANVQLSMEFDLNTNSNLHALGDDIIYPAAFWSWANNNGAASGGNNRGFGGAQVFAPTAPKGDANYGDMKNGSRGGNRDGHRGCYFNDLNTLTTGGWIPRSAAEGQLHTARPDDDDCDNDYTLGPDGCPGLCGVDDDHNGIIDDAKEICPCKRCNGGPRNGAGCNVLSECNIDGSSTVLCASSVDANGKPISNFTGSIGDDVCGDGTVDEGVSATFGGNAATIKQDRNGGINSGVGVGGRGRRLGNIAFQTMEDVYGQAEPISQNWQADVGFIVFERQGSESVTGYGVTMDDVVIEWQETHPVAQAGTTCSQAGFSGYQGQCAKVNLGAELDTFDGDTSVPVTVIDPFVTAADNLVDCNSDGTKNEVQVLAYAPSEPNGETLCLVQTGAGTNTFTGAVRLTTRVNVAGDNYVYLSYNGSLVPQISVRYIDKYDGVHSVDSGPDGKPGIANFDDDGDGTIDEADELCPTNSRLGPGRSPHQPGQKARYSDDNCGCPDNPIVDTTPARFDTADVTVSDVKVLDNGTSGSSGDGDRWADPGETIVLDLVLKNYSNFPIQNAVLTLTSPDNVPGGKVECLVDGEIRIPTIPAFSRSTGPGTYDTATGSDHFVFRAGSTQLRGSDTTKDFSSSFNVSLVGLAKGGPQYAISADVPIFGTQVPQKFKIVHNLNASAQPAPTTFFDNFESYVGDSDVLAQWPRFNTGDDAAELDGTRCQYNDPSNPFTPQRDPAFFCELGETFNNSENHWHLHGPTRSASPFNCEKTSAADVTRCNDGGRSHTYPNGAEPTNCPSSADPNQPGCKQSLSGSNLRDADQLPNVGNWYTMDTSRMTWAEKATSVQLGSDRPELSYWTQVSVENQLFSGTGSTDSTTAYATYICVDKNGNNDCDTKETGTKDGSEKWEKLKAYYNPELATRFQGSSRCSYDPSDDGNTEDDLFPNDNLIGPSSTCFPEYVDVCLGRTDQDLASAGITAALDDNCWPERRVQDYDESKALYGNPNLKQFPDYVNWIQKKFHLDQYRGQKVLVRFHISPFGVAGIENWHNFLTQRDNRDDGVFIDDVKITDVVSGMTLSNDDVIHGGGQSCPASPVSGLKARAAVVPSPRNDNDGNPKKARACAGYTGGSGDVCDFNQDGTTDTGSATTPNDAPGRPYILSGRDSGAAQCIGGALEYRWAVVSGGIVRDFLTDPEAVVNPQTTTTYRLTLRCTADTSQVVTADVTIDNSLAASCNLITNSLSMSANKTTISWSGSGTFDVAKGNIAQIPTWSLASCLQNNTSSTSATDGATPGAGTGFYYVVRCDSTGNYNDGTQSGSRSITACP